MAQALGVFGDPSDEAQAVANAAQTAGLSGRVALQAANLSAAQLDAAARSPQLGAVVGGTAVHNAAARAVLSANPTWIYNASRGPDFFTGTKYIELTTYGAMNAHIMRYGAEYGGYPVEYVMYWW